MKLTITHHAKVRWFERFNRIIDRIQIEEEIEYNFKRAKLYRKNNILLLFIKTMMPILLLGIGIMKELL